MWVICLPCHALCILFSLLFSDERRIRVDVVTQPVE
jgi:hypothetical protein